MDDDNVAGNMCLTLPHRKAKDRLMTSPNRHGMPTPA